MQIALRAQRQEGKAKNGTSFAIRAKKLTCHQNDGTHCRAKEITKAKNKRLISKPTRWQTL
jgi:hypothetical protein